jgi:hypothetical protein
MRNEVGLCGNREMLIMQVILFDIRLEGWGLNHERDKVPVSW